MQRILAGLSSVLNAFTQLSFLDLSPTAIDGVGRADSSEEHGLCVEWHRACPTLRRVVFPSQTEWVLNCNDMIWNIRVANPTGTTTTSTVSVSSSPTLSPAAVPMMEC